MLEDTQKQLWVISENSISKFNPQQGTFENYGSNYFQRELNLTEAVPTLTSQKKIVLGTNQGILEINTEQMKKVLTYLLLYLPDSKYKEVNFM